MATAYPALLIPRVTLIPDRLSASDAIATVRDDLRDLGRAVDALGRHYANGDLATIGTRLDVLAGVLGELVLDVAGMEEERDKCNADEVFRLEGEVQDLTDENEALESDVDRLEKELAACRAAKKGKRQ